MSHENDERATGGVRIRFANHGKAVPAGAARMFLAIAVVASALCWGASAAEADSALNAPVPIGVELGGKAVRVACHGTQGVRFVPFPKEDAAAIAERFARTSCLTAEDAGSVKSVLVSTFGTNRVQDVVLALPRGLPWDSRRRIFAAFSQNGIGIARCVDRTTACAFALMHGNPSFSGRVVVEDRGADAPEVSVASMDDGVCEVEEVGDASAVHDVSKAQKVKIEDDDLDVVQGAALQAGVLKGTNKDHLLLDVAGYEIGILTGDDEFHALIERNTTIPAKRSRRVCLKGMGEVYIGAHDGKGRFQKLAGPFACAHPDSGQVQMMEIDVDVNRDVSVCWLVDKDGNKAGKGVALFREGSSRFVPETWEPGRLVEGTPHVMAGEKPGIYVAEAGWQFADVPWNASDMPFLAEEVVVHAALESVKIPAPSGFWSLDDDNPIAKLLKVQAESDKANKTPGLWVRTEDGDWGDLQQACVKIVKNLDGKKISLSDFTKVREAMRRDWLDVQGQALSLANKSAGAVSREMASLVETNVNVAVGDFKFRPPHLEKEDRLGFTVVSKEMADVGGEKSMSFTVNSFALVWIRGVVFSLHLSETVSEEKAVDAAVASTRKKLEEWLERVDKANGRTSLIAEDMLVRADPTHVRLPNDPKKKTPFWTKVLIWAIIGAVWGVVSSLFKKKSKGKSSDD